MLKHISLNAGAYWRAASSPPVLGAPLTPFSTSELPQLVRVVFRLLPVGVEQRTGLVTSPLNVDDKRVTLRIGQFALDEVIARRRIEHERPPLIFVAGRRVGVEQCTGFDGLVTGPLNVDDKGNTTLVRHLALHVVIRQWHDESSVWLAILD